MASKLRLVMFGVGGLAGLAVLAIGGGYAWAKATANAKLAQTYEVHEVDFPVPFPLSEEEIEELRAEKLAEAGGAEDATDAAPEAAAGTDGEGEDEADPLEGVDVDAVALERARARGKHLVEARYACIGCHGADFGGGKMVDDPMIGTILGPNITSGGVTADYTVATWDRAVRHGILPDGKPSAMPSEDFVAMSDRELSDIIAYIRSIPAVGEVVPKPSLGPLGTVLIATGQLQLSAERHPDHHADHLSEPPETAETQEFGRHLAQVCTGCHRPELNGGPVAAGPPDWPPAGNLTPHADGLADWSYDDFVTTMREAKRPDGTPLRPPMNEIAPMAKNMTDTEMKAMWMYLQSLEPLPDGQ